jgi:uncharacterized protein (TIGR03083 family)
MRHVGEVYEHKVLCMELGREPDASERTVQPQDDFEAGTWFIAQRDALLDQLTVRGPLQASPNWLPPDQSVGFWYRRMALETAVHRVDTELAVGTRSDIDPELAADGVDELVGFLTYDFEDSPAIVEGADRIVELRCGQRRWAVTLRTDGVVRAAEGDVADATVKGQPGDLLLYLWNRDRDGVAVLTWGDPAALAVLIARLEEETDEKAGLPTSANSMRSRGLDFNALYSVPPRGVEVPSPRPARGLVVALLCASALFGCSSTDDVSSVTATSAGAVSTTTSTTTVPPTTTTTVPPSTTTTAAPAPPPGTPRPIYATSTNPLTTSGSLSRVACTLPTWSNDTAQAFLDVALGCLNTAWKPVLELLRLPFTPASVTVSSDAPAQFCGRPPEQNSFYCNGVIHLDPSSYETTVTGQRGIPAAAVAMLAHEFGHHVQQLSGTLPAAVEQMDAAGRHTPAGLEISRRAEMQAQCLSGMFIGATFDAVSVALAQEDNYSRGDAPGAEPTHGLPQNFGDWFTKGAHRNSLDVCNTWAVPPELVG